MRKTLLAILLLPLLATAQTQPPASSSTTSEELVDVLRILPVASAFTLKVCGVDGESSWKRLAVNTAASYAIAAGTTWSLKHTVRRRRPDGSDHHSFPSGHSTVAFAGAHILYKEYGRRSLWYGAAGYGVATAVAAQRVARDRHHWSDVLAGAAIGILGTEIGYRLGDRITGETTRLSIAAGPTSLSLAVVF